MLSSKGFVSFSSSQTKIEALEYNENSPTAEAIKALMDVPHACGSSKFNLLLCSPKSIVLVVYEMNQFIVYCNDTIPTIMALQVLKMVCYQVTHSLSQSDSNVFTLKMLGFFCVCVCIGFHLNSLS